jgi:lipoate-protein ligase A
MALDEALLEAMPQLNRPVLRFYGWDQRAASFGYFQRHSDVERSTLLRPLVRRPTGGGLVPHDADWTYSLVFPIDHEWYGLTAVDSYRRDHEWIQASLSLLALTTELAPAARKTGQGQCFQGYERFDVLWRGNKIAGAAQRRRRDGLLIQGSLQPPWPNLQRDDWHKAMWDAGHDLFSVDWEDLSLEPALKMRADQLSLNKYSRDEYNRRR